MADVWVNLDEEVEVAPGIWVALLKVQGTNLARLGITAPQEMRIRRGEQKPEARRGRVPDVDRRDVR